MPKLTFRAIGIDPGGTTGICFASKYEGMPLEVKPRQERMSCADMLHFLTKLDPEKLFIICESFEYRKGQGKVDYTPVELIGVVKAVYEQEKKLFLQSAATGKGYYSDAVLKQSNLYVRGVPHGLDAMRHVLHWYTFKFGYQFNDTKEITLG